MAIEVRRAGELFFLWDPEDAVVLRTEHHFAVAGVGPTMTKAQHQARCGTLPVALSAVEVLVGLHEGRMRCDEEEVAVDSAVELRRYIVYRTLWRAGLHLTRGVKFGADFLAYAGAYAPGNGQFPDSFAS